jgi:uncharacterized membrane protein
MLTSTTLTIWLYDSAMGAAAGEVRLKDLEQQGAVSVVDALTVTWMPGAEGPQVRPVKGRGGAGLAKGSILGGLVGSLFMAPLAGAAAGAAVAKLAHKLRDTGIDGAFLEEVTSRLRPGTSALVVLSNGADLDVVRVFVERGLARGDVTLMHARLQDDAPAALRQLVGPGPGPSRSGMARSG